MAETYDVYYGESEAGLDLVSAEQAGLSFTISGVTYGSPFEHGISRFWRIDATNEYGTTTGDVWTFTAISFKPPLPTGFTKVDGTNASGTTGTPTGENNMMTVKKLMAAAGNKVWYEAI